MFNIFNKQSKQIWRIFLQLTLDDGKIDIPDFIIIILTLCKL